MIKFRFMVVNADKTRVTSTFGGNRRITSVRRFVRAYKIDELIKTLDAREHRIPSCLGGNEFCTARQDFFRGLSGRKVVFATVVRRTQRHWSEASSK